MEETTEPNEEKPKSLSGFLGDLTDGRRKGDWKSRYDDECHTHIILEKKYLLILIFLSLVVPVVIGLTGNYYLLFTSPGLKSFKIYLFSFFGGTLGGTLFAAKWLVHSVAKNTWNLDRKLWRLFTPLLSGALGFIVVLLINSNLFKDSQSGVLTIHKSYGIGFLVGYFSDNAIGKLTEIAQVFFGSSLSNRK